MAGKREGKNHNDEKSRKGVLFEQKMKKGNRC